MHTEYSELDFKEEQVRPSSVTQMKSECGDMQFMHVRWLVVRTLYVREKKFIFYRFINGDKTMITVIVSTVYLCRLCFSIQGSI